MATTLQSPFWAENHNLWTAESNDWDFGSSDAETIDGGFQDVGHGMQVRFSPGVYTINDEWELEVSGILDSRTMAIKYATAERI